jgi:hypothetical protein
VLQSPLLLLGSDFQRLDLPLSSGFPNCQRSSATCFSHQQLTTTEPQQSSDSLTHQPITLHFKVKVRVKVTLRLMVYRQSVRLGVKPLISHNLLSFICFTYINVYCEFLSINSIFRASFHCLFTKNVNGFLSFVSKCFF